MKSKTQRRKKHQKRTRRGGKKIGEGKYGYVVHPGIPCKGKDPNTYVSKIYKDKGYTRKISERDTLQQLIAKLKEVDPEQKYFLYPEICEAYGDLSEENKADGVTEEDKKYSYMVKLGGEALLNHPLIKQSYEFTDKYYEEERKGARGRKNAMAILEGYKQTATEDFDKYVALLTPIVPIIDKLHEAGYMHKDIHPGNILIMKDGTPRLIDFDEGVKAIRDVYHTKEQVHLMQIESIAEIAPYAGIYTDLFFALRDALMKVSTYKAK